jgi:hypothetical protein
MVILEVLTPLPLTQREDGQTVLDLWQTFIPELLPDFFGNWEPIDRVFNRQKLDAALDQWKWPFLAIKKKPAVDASIWMRKSALQKLHAILIFRFEPKSAAPSQLLEFLKATSIGLKADFGCLHLFNETEFQRGRSNKTVRALDKQGKKLSFLLASQDLRRRIPELYWATVLGAPYLQMFGKDRVLAAPAYSTVSLSSEAVLLQMTENLIDLEERFDRFDEVRSRVKTWLGQDAFFDMRNEASKSYRVPAFRLFDAEGEPLA